MIKQYLYNHLLGLDQYINVILLGDPDESISGRLGRAVASGRPKWFVPPTARFVDWMFRVTGIEDNHVANAVEPEERPHEKELWCWYKV